MTKIEKIEELLGQVEDDIRKRLIKDILSELQDFAKDAIAEERPGFAAAIEVIEANFPV